MRRPTSLIVLALLAMALAGCTDAGDIPTETDADGNVIGPSWSFTDTNGTAHSRDRAMGDPTILFFMATWCSSCRAQTAPLADVHAAHEENGVDVFSVSFDPSETEADLERWKERYDQPWPHGVDPNGQIAKTFRITSQSSLVVLDHKGLPVEVFRYPGASEAQLNDAIERAIARQAE